MSIRKFISKIILRYKSEPKTIKRFINWNSLSKITLILEQADLQNIASFTHLCEQTKIKLHLLILPNKLESSNSIDGKVTFNYLTKSFVTYFLIPKNIVLIGINKFNSDLIINLCPEHDLRAHALSKLIRASCKMSNFYNPLYNISIVLNSQYNVADFLQQSYNYLSMIKPKE